jgi:pimeloyl-ACP methyl ester carboxylesterase
MRLEIISRYPASTAKSTPLLFVHGSFAGAQVWDEHFLPYFARQGYAAHAVSLRGHGASAGQENLRWWSLKDYVTDLARAVQELDRQPVLIAHSMGGMVVQKYLEADSAAGMVLMASVPPHGLLPTFWGMALDQPLLLCQLALLQSLGPEVGTLTIMRQALFSDNTTDAQISGYFHLLQGESQRVSLDMLGLDPLRRMYKKLAIPTLVMGAEQDSLVSPSLVRDTARCHGVDAVIFKDMAHAMMLEAHWQRVASHLLGWLNKHFAATD